MRSRPFHSLSIAVLASMSLALAAAAETKTAAPAEPAAAPAAGGDLAATPKATAEAAAKGTLTSPYKDNPNTVAEEGHKIYMAAGCNGCHGGSGGGGMGPPLTNQVWIYGKDDDTLYRLTALGSDALLKDGYNRKGSEAVVGPMPAMGEIVKTSDDMWKIIAWMRSINPDSQAPSTAETAP